MSTNKGTQTGFRNNLKAYVEAWFDNHPEPENLELFEFPELLPSNACAMTVFTADQVHDNYMIKLTFHTAKKAAYVSQQIYEVVRVMNLTSILINRNLFLFTDRRF